MRRRAPFPRAGRALVAALALACLVPAVAAAQAVDQPASFAGDVLSRPRLSGDWLGYRDELAKRGVTLDVDWLQVLQGVGTGGRDTGVAYGGTVDYTFNVDTGKLGLWPGGFLKAYAMSGYGDSENSDAGAIGAVNASALFPVPSGTSTALMNLTFTQFLTPWLGVAAGKFYTLDSDRNEFADDYRTKFMNMGFEVNLAALLVPISAWGGGIIVLPWDGAVFSALVLDPNGSPTDNSFDDAFDGGWRVAAEGRVTVKPFGLVGHQTVGFTWSQQQRLALAQDPANTARLLLTARFPRLADPGPLLERILRRFFPGALVPGQAPKTVGDNWAVYYNFDQFLWSPAGDPARGIGAFFRFGASDGEVNPVKYHYNVGLGGKGVVPGRPFDTFGVGWSRIELSDKFVPFLRQSLGLGLDKEDAVELYYNASITRWLNVTADLQIVNPALRKTLGASGQLVGVDTAVVGGLRAYVRF